MKLFLIILIICSCSEPFKKRKIYEISILRKLILFNSQTISVTPASTPIPVNLNKYIFITNNLHNGNFDSDSTLALNGAVNGNNNAIEEIDQFCRKEKDANFSSLPGTGSEYKALISDGTNRIACTSINCNTSGSTESKDWVLKPNTIYYRFSSSSDTMIFKTDSNIGIIKLSTGLNLDSVVDTIAGKIWWTGLDTTWRNDLNCSGWKNSTIQFGNRGLSNSIGTGFIYSDDIGCSNSNRILCVRQ